MSIIIIFHADDYGVNISQCRRIMLCSENGLLNSISIMPNSAVLHAALKEVSPEINKAIHINFSEGYICASQNEVPLLHKDGKFFRSYISLLLLSIARKRAFEEQAYAEISAQLKAVICNLPPAYKIRIDSHLHVHMIPGVFHAMCRALRDSGREVDHIRFSTETFSVYLKTPQIWRFIRPINIVKASLTKFFGFIDMKMLRKFGYEDKVSLFYGLGFAGKMYGNHVRIILDKYVELANRDNKSLEVLFHPGGIQKGEQYLSGCPESFKRYYSSDDRVKEAEMLKQLANVRNYGK